MSQGTPKTLDEAISIILTSSHIERKSLSLRDFSYFVIKDFLVHRFSSASFRAESAVVADAIQGLYLEIVRREMDPAPKGDE